MFKDLSVKEIDAVLIQAQEAFAQYKMVNGADKAEFLEAIAAGIESVGDELVKTGMQETNLPEARLVGERGRTCNQLRQFAALLKEGSWVEARIDTANPDRTPMPKPDLRKMLVPIGPVVVFGASNFPFAYSTAGVDTASALAAGCPVVLKAHPAHPATSELVAGVIAKAIEKTHMPKHTFQHVHGSSFESGKALVQHPLTKAVGFTGSFSGGKALYDYAAQRTEPIPVFAEMGSINPVFILPGALKARGEKVADMYAASITQSVGQFCTNPGLMLTIQSGEVNQFEAQLGEKMKKIAPGTMLHPEWRFCRVLELAPVRFVGRISYSLYLWQQLFLTPGWLPKIGVLQQWPWNLLATFAAATASYFLIEKPCIRFGRLAADRAWRTLKPRVTAIP